MRVLFLGTPEFAVPALCALHEKSYEICGIFTQPDRPSGRGKKLQASPVKAYAQKRGIPVYQPERIRQDENRKIFEDVHPDFIVVAAYGQILPAWILQSARIAPVNIHASLLPHYRGAAPIAWAIINGEALTGVTIMRMQEKLDSGPIMAQESVPISLTMTAGELTTQLAEMGAALLVRTLPDWEILTPAIQDESRVSWAPRISKTLAGILWDKPAWDVHNLIRGMNPWPVAHSDFHGDRLQIWSSLPENESSLVHAAPGTFLGLKREAAIVQCGGGTALSILEVQMPGKSRITGREFANGVRLKPGDRLQ
jgi:methionyl-tRNA formyltransferase